MMQREVMRGRLHQVVEVDDVSSGRGVLSKHDTKLAAGLKSAAFSNGSQRGCSMSTCSAVRQGADQARLHSLLLLFCSVCQVVAV